MKTIRSFLFVLAASALAAFAVPASAQKIYTMAVQSTGSGTVAVTITNVTPPSEPGNSTINSFVINKPAGVAALSAGSSSPAGASIVIDGSGNARVSNFTGLKSAGKNPNTITINLAATYT